MADYENLLDSIDAVIRSNNRREITGQILQNTLHQMVASLGENYQLAGFATPTLDPNNPDQNVFYITDEAGVYTNFDNITLGAGLSFLMWKNEEWTSKTLDIVTADWVDEHYVSKAFLRKVFQFFDEDGVEIFPNDTESVVDNIKAMCGLWTNEYLSALGLGEGSTIPTTLAALNDVTITNPQDGQALVYDAASLHWVNATIQSGVDMSVVWAALAAATNEQINISHLTTALNDYVTATSLATTLQSYVTTSALATELASYASQSWVETNYVSKAFFNSLFEAQDVNGNAITPNNSGQTTIDRLKILVGAYTEQYLSALGLSSGGGGGGSSTLAGLNDVTITNPQDGQALIYDAQSSHWVNGAAISMSAVWTALAAATSEQINSSHLTSALSGYVTTSALASELANYVTTSSLATTLADYVTTSALAATLADYGSKTWIDNNYVSKAFFNRLFQAFAPLAEGQTEPTQVEPNDTTTTIDNIKAMVDFWSQGGITALGQGSQGGGGGGQGDVTWDALRDGNDSRPIALSHLTGALASYATQSWVQGLGYITSSGSCAFATGSTYTSYPAGFTSRVNYDWSGVAGVLATDWSVNGADIMFKYDGGALNVITDGRFYQGIDVYGSSKRVLDEYDITNTTWGNADTLDGEHGSYYAAASSLANYLPLTGGTISGTVTSNGFIKSGSSDSDVLLGGGGHKSIASLNVKRAEEVGMPQLLSTMNIWNTSYASLVVYRNMGHTSGAPTNYPYGFLHNYQWLDGGDNMWVSQFYFTVSDYGNEIFTRGYIQNTTSWTDWKKFWHSGNLINPLTANNYSTYLGSVYHPYGGSNIISFSASTLNLSGQLISSVSTGTSPLSVSSTTLVSNLNADMVDGVHNGNLTSKYINFVTGDTDFNVWESASGIMSIHKMAGVSTNCPTNHPYGYLFNFSWSQNSWSGQLYYTVSDYGSEIYTRGYRADTSSWTEWRKFWHSHNSNLSTVDWTCNNLTAYGNVGIGVSPSYKLHVNGESYFADWMFVNSSVTALGIELQPSSSSAGHGGHIDFHYNRSSSDYTTRLIEDASGRLKLIGDFYATGGVTALSDERHKRIVENTRLQVSDIAKMRAVRYIWNDGREDKGIHVGSIAQDWQQILPEVVLRANDAEGTLSLQYGVAALISSITIARKVVDHEQRITELERENADLKQAYSFIKNAYDYLKMDYENLKLKIA